MTTKVEARYLEKAEARAGGDAGFRRFLAKAIEAIDPDDLITSVRAVMVRPLQVVLLLGSVRILGTLHAPPGALRFSEAWEELISDDRRFLPVTDATVISLADDHVVEKVPFLQVAKDQVWGALPATESS